MPRPTCLWRVLYRLVHDGGWSRPDLPQGADERFDLALLRSIWRYPREAGARVLGLLGSLDERVAVHHLTSRAHVTRFLNAL